MEKEELDSLDVSFLHTSHCLPDGTVMISSLGDKEGKAKGECDGDDSYMITVLGEFVLLDAKTFKVAGKWNKESVGFGYGFWYQPRHNVMISTEWGEPNEVLRGFDPKALATGKCRTENNAK